MKIAILTILLLLGFDSFRPLPPQKSDEKAPGDDWKQLSELEKLSYVRGWGDGEDSAVRRECSARVVARLDMKGFDRCMREKNAQIGVPHNYTMGQFVDGMDHFYSDYRNKLVLNYVVAEEVEKQINGAGDSEIEADLEIARKVAQKTSQAAGHGN